MQVQQVAQAVHFQGKLKAQILKQIFKDLGPKNLKGVEFFYLIVNKQMIKMQFTSAAKDISIIIMLQSSLFQHYRYNRERPSLHKYALQDFTGIGFFFQNNKLILDLDLTIDQFAITSRSGKGYAQYIATPLNCDQDDEDFIVQDLRPEEQSSMEMRLGKVGYFEGILSYAKGCKLNSLWLRFDSVGKRLEVADRAQSPQVRWWLKVQESRLHNFDRPIEFHYKSLACALNLLPNDSELILTFYSSFILLDVPEKEKTFTVRINAKSDQL